MKYIALLFLVYVCFVAQAEATNSRIEEFTITSTALSGNLIGLNPDRNIRVYLPASYTKGIKRYPVVYYFHSLGWSNEKFFCRWKRATHIG